MRYRTLSLVLFFAAIVMLFLSLGGGGVDTAADALILISLSIFLRWLDARKMTLSPSSFPAEKTGDPVRFRTWYYGGLVVAVAVIAFSCISYL